LRSFAAIQFPSLGLSLSRGLTILNSQQQHCPGELQVGAVSSDSFAEFNPNSEAGRQGSCDASSQQGVGDAPSPVAAAGT
jgi:hypothetical protein